MRGAARYRRHREGEELNISPLIDMTFLLLIFFMVSATFVRENELEIERPGAASATEAEAGSVRVTLDRRGGLFVDGRPVQPWMIQSYVRERLARTGVSSVLVVVDGTVRSEVLVEVIDDCRLAGARDVGVAVEEESS